MSPPFGFHQVWPTNSVAGQSQPTNRHQINDFCSNNNNNNNNNKEDIDEEASFEQFPAPSRLGNFLKSTIDVGVGRSSHSTEPFQGKMAATLAYRVLLSASRRAELGLPCEFGIDPMSDMQVEELHSFPAPFHLCILFEYSPLRSGWSVVRVVSGSDQMSHILPLFTASYLSYLRQLPSCHPLLENYLLSAHF